MRPDFVWYHVIWNTHNSWLPGDPRGFRDHEHRIHSSGDFRNPPPAGEHENLLRYNQTRAGPAVQLAVSVRPLIVDAILDAIARREGSAAAVSVADEHVHLLAALPPNYDEAKAIVGKLKTISSLAVREQLPGTIWSRGCVLKRVDGKDYWNAAFRYVTEKQEQSACVWRWEDKPVSHPEESTASAVAFENSIASPDATAEAVDSSAPVDRESNPNLFHQSDAIEVRRVTNRGKGGRGVFARRDIAQGELIERVPVLLVPRTQVFGTGDVARRAARISWYVFEWLTTRRGYVALALGYGSIYNHSDDPNAEYDMEPPDVMTFSALKDVTAGEEILISYAGGAGVMKDLGFEPEKTPPHVTDAMSDVGGGAGRTTVVGNGTEPAAE